MFEDDIAEDYIIGAWVNSSDTGKLRYLFFRLITKKWVLRFYLLCYWYLIIWHRCDDLWYHVEDFGCQWTS